MELCARTASSPRAWASPSSTHRSLFLLELDNSYRPARSENGMACELSDCVLGHHVVGVTAFRDSDLGCVRVGRDSPMWRGVDVRRAPAMSDCDTRECDRAL